MIRCALLSLVLASSSQLATGTAAAAPTGTPCAQLTALTIPTVTISAAAEVAAGAFTPPGAQTALTVPAFCRVEAIARPTSDSEIRFEVWIPPASAWNGKFHGAGRSPSPHTRSTPDSRHCRPPPRGVTHDQFRRFRHHVNGAMAVVDELLGMALPEAHVVAGVARVRTRRGVAPGLRQRLLSTGRAADEIRSLGESSQRYPDDYDGIVAGDPANNRIRQTFGFLASWIATHDAAGASIIPPAKLALLTRSAVAACDKIDGLEDGLIDDPRRCTFDPATVACSSSADDANCLTAPQVAAAKRMYEGTKHPRTGELIFTGWPRGSEGFGAVASQGWRQYILDPVAPMRSDFFRYWLFHDPNWDFRTVDLEGDLAYAEQKLPFLAAVEKDLTAFKKRGGKLLSYTGWLDPVVPPQDTVAYYEGVTKAMGGPAATRDFYRLFMAPGMGHCAGGPGPNQFDALGALEQWVEKGIAPDAMVATHRTDGQVDRTRPLCPYPQVARHKGTGSVDEAANFSCVTPTSRQSSRR